MDQNIILYYTFLYFFHHIYTVQHKVTDVKDIW